jgi:hypothetical protein
MAGRRAPGKRETARGQGMTEVAMIMPVILFVLTGMVELGLVAHDALTIGYGSREGARVGSALGTGGVSDCSGGSDPAAVDATVIASVQSIIKSQGSGIELEDISEVRIFKATSSGAKTPGKVNTWRYSGPGTGPDVDPGPGVLRVDFTESSTGWPACGRVADGSTPDSIGVEVVYERRLVTPLAALMDFFGGSQSATIALSETTVMALNPTY